ncbi:MAG TPA: DUF2752 domain-containing protein [Planctomycetota bacterium]|nr:DUF2752 domain-containing protein [Planctomycetota bacterium]
MPEQSSPSARSPFLIPLADGPVAAWVDRLAAVSTAAAAMAGVVMLWRVEPDARGHGTHEQFGMDPCGWPVAYGFPCPTCGCTTAACHLVHGHVLQAFATQPFGMLAAGAGVLLGAHALWCLARKRSFADLLVRLPFWRIVAAASALLLLAWGYKCLVWQP